MPLDEQTTRALLRELDDPRHIEFPLGHDAHAARSRYERLAARLDERFRCACDVDRHIEDASHHGRIEIPASATESGERITVVLSNFGGLAVATLGLPGSHDAEEEELFFHAADRRRVEGGLGALGYVAVSEHPLWDAYDGAVDLGVRTPPTWWHRFFDHL